MLLYSDGEGGKGRGEGVLQHGGRELDKRLVLGKFFKTSEPRLERP